MKPGNKKLIGLVVIALLVIGGTGAAIVMSNNDANSEPNTAAVGGQDTTQSTDSAKVTTYKDGSYSATGNYRAPSGTEKIGVTATIADGKLTDVQIETFGRGDSAEYQQMFKYGIGILTVGKNIDEVKVSRVSGSSLTSAGFNSALEEIKNEARS